MTREIALHCMKSYSELHSDLCGLCPIYGQTGSYHCFEDALQYVIGMLEQEPATKNDKVDCKHTDCNNCVNHKYCDYEPTTKNNLGVDCVSRTLVQSAISKSIEYKENPYQLYKRIESLPSVTPQEPRTGHWIYIGNSGVNGLKICKCSNCKKKTYGSHKFCPNCGAKMESKENENG